MYQIFVDEVLGSGQFGIVYGGESRDTAAHDSPESGFWGYENADGLLFISLLIILGR